MHSQLLIICKKDTFPIQRMHLFYYLCKEKKKTFKPMESNTLFEICGWIASISMILGYLPQAIETIKTRNTDGIALPTFLMMGVGGLCFMLQGILHKPDILWALFITNLVTTTCSFIVGGIKVYNDYFKKKQQ